MNGRLLAGLLLTVVGCRPDSQATTLRQAAAAKDSTYAGVQSRGETAMGVDQYTSSHVFQPLDDGGRIELRRDAADSVGGERIRRHMEEIATRFGAGDFALPGFVHAQRVPGTDVMTAKREEIRYEVEPLPRGAALRIRTADPAAVRAIHEFLAFQRRDHHAPAHPD